MKHHPVSEEIVEVLKNKTQSSITDFFRVTVAFHLSRMESMMHTKVETKDRGVIPVNCYAIALAPSGLGKGNSTNVLEEQITAGFRTIYMEKTFPSLAKKSLKSIGHKRFNASSNIKKTLEDEVLKVESEFEDLGDLPYDYDSGTPAAFKQVRHKCLMAEAGALNFFVDEIGDNLLTNSDMLKVYLEAFDVGKIKQKITKNTADNKRLKEINGKVPCNMLLFGTPAKLLDGAKTEEEFMIMQETGYARRCFFAYSTGSVNDVSLTPEQVYDLAVSDTDIIVTTKLNKLFVNLAKEANFGITIQMDKAVNLQLIEYRQSCEKLANEYPEHKFIHKAEMGHRYFKALKLSGAYAFIDSSPKVTAEHLHAAIKMAEESGDAFHRILARERPFIKLAKFIGSYGSELTKSDIIEELPCYKGNELQKKEMMKLAIEHGYKNNIIIKETERDGIDFYKGEMLQETDTDKIVLSYSTDITKNYKNHTVSFNQLHKLTTANGLHWVARHLRDGYRDTEHGLPETNLIVLDIDDGKTTPELINLILGKYQYHLYFTKRHTPEKPRFRLIFPMSHVLKLNVTDYKEFMTNLGNWLPFKIDEQATDYSRKWLSSKAKYIYNDGETLNVLPFIPKTKEADKRKKIFTTTQSLNNLERFFVRNLEVGSRNNQLARYAFCLVDSGLDQLEIRDKVIALNSKLPSPLDTIEIDRTLMISVAKKIQQKGTK